MKPDHSIQDTIFAYFNGNLSPAEEDRLLRWIKESAENRKVFLRYKRMIEPDKMNHPLLKSSYAELKSRLLLNRQFRPVKAKRVRKIQLSFLKIASMLLLAVTLGFAIAYILTGNPSGKNNVVWFESKVPRGEKSQLLLPDGSKVWMNSESSLLYPSNFMDGNRDVKLRGEACFEVAKQHGSVFTVETHDYNIRVLGTRFNVMAYKDFKRTETTLIEGRIEIQKGKQTIEVAPGHTFTCKGNQFFTTKTNALKSAKWKDDIFDFDRVTFHELVARLERWYDVDIEIESPELNKVIYSGVFKNEETLEQVLGMVQLTMPIRYKKDDFRKFSIWMNK